MNLQKESKIRVLIVDDSAGMRMMLEWIFGHDPDLEVAGIACAVFTPDRCAASMRSSNSRHVVVNDATGPCRSC